MITTSYDMTVNGNKNHFIYYEACFHIEKHVTLKAFIEHMQALEK